MRIGVLTGGGDCPGLNAVIPAVVRKGVGVQGHEFVGYRDGWRGPLEDDRRPLGVPEVRGILPRGANAILIPEREFDVDAVCDLIERRFAGHFAPIIVVAEGARPVGGLPADEDAKTDSFCHARLGGGVGRWSRALAGGRDRAAHR